MSRLAGFPLGLLDLVGSQNFGEAPRDLGGTVVPMVDVTGLYEASKLSVAFNTGTDVLAAGQNTAKTFTLTVPQNELWHVLNVSIFLSTGVGEALTAYPWMQSPVGGGVIALGRATTLAASIIGWGIMEIAPFYATAGTKFGIWGSGITGVPTAAVTALINRMRC